MDMKKSFSLSSVAIVLLTVAVVVMSVGYANFTAKLDINGTANVGASSWSVKFDEGSYDETNGSVSVAESDRTIVETSMTYEVSLTKPGDFYEFTIDVQNSGTFDANLTGITLTALTEAQKKYLVYEVYYNGTKYTATTENITDVVLASKTSAPVKVKVQYIQPDKASDLPESEQSIKLDASLSFAQKTQ